MGNSEQEQSQEATQEPSTVRCGAIAQDERGAVSEEKREEQVELAFGKSHDEESGDQICRPVDGCLSESFDADPEERGVDNNDPEQGDPSQTIGQGLA